MQFDEWISGYKVECRPWFDGQIYFSVSYYRPGQSICQPPVWEKTAYIIDNEAGRKVINDFSNTLTDYIAQLKIPKGGHAVLTFQ